MPYRNPKPCLLCGQPTRNQPAHCTACQPATPRAHRNRYAWQQRRAQAKAEWLQRYGPMCAGWQRPPHPVPTAQLTIDHINPHTMDGPLQALCRACNSAKSDNR